MQHEQARQRINHQLTSQLNSNMFLLNICIHAGLLLALPWCTHQACTQGKPNECLEADFAPGINLAGEGFDITKMERKGAFVIDMNQWKHKDKTCTLCTNPYLENKKQKLPLSVVDWRAKHSCSMKVSSQLHRSSESLVGSSTSSVENDWKASLEANVRTSSGKLMLAGTNSKLSEYANAKSKNDKFSFTSHSMACEYYSYRVSNSPKLHKEFRKAVNQLPKAYTHENKQRFYKLIDNFGTHYITKVKLGGSVQSITSIRQCQASLQGLSSEEVQMCLNVEASATIAGNEAGAEVKHCKADKERTDSKTSFAGLFNDRVTEIRGGHTMEPDLLFSSDKDPSAYKEWLATLPQNPDIFSYSLDSLHELLPSNSAAWKNLRSAISHYILEKGLMKNCSERCQAGIRSNSRDPCTCQCHNEPAVNQDCCPTRKGMARIRITIQRATGLWGDHITATDGYVRVFFNGQQVQRSPVINNNNNPHWNMMVDLDSQDLSREPPLRFEVWDQDNNYDDDLLGQCSQILSSGVKEDLCVLQHGKLYFKWEVKCAPHLSGNLCTDYMSTPMSQSLKSLYVSRHSHRIPKNILLKMGVFVDQTSSPTNQSLNVRAKSWNKTPMFANPEADNI